MKNNGEQTRKNAFGRRRNGPRGANAFPAAAAGNMTVSVSNNASKWVADVTEVSNWVFLSHCQVLVLWLPIAIWNWFLRAEMCPTRVLLLSMALVLNSPVYGFWGRLWLEMKVWYYSKALKGGDWSKVLRAWRFSGWGSTSSKRLAWDGWHVGSMGIFIARHTAGLGMCCTKKSIHWKHHKEVHHTCCRI